MCIRDSPRIGAASTTSPARNRPPGSGLPKSSSLARPKPPEPACPRLSLFRPPSFPVQHAGPPTRACPASFSARPLGSPFPPGRRPFSVSSRRLVELYVSFPGPACPPEMRSPRLSFLPARAIFARPRYLHSLLTRILSLRHDWSRDCTVRCNVSAYTPARERKSDGNSRRLDLSGFLHWLLGSPLSGHRARCSG